MAHGHRVVRELGHELLNGCFRIEPDLDGVGPHEGPAENAAGETRDVVPLERLQHADDVFVALAI